jgi:hypothetical protein
MSTTDNVQRDRSESAIGVVTALTAPNLTAEVDGAVLVYRRFGHSASGTGAVPAALPRQSGLLGSDPG